jgi:ABC-type sugar transport system substrate-binding protein
LNCNPKDGPYTTKVLSFANHPSLDALVACNEEVIGALDPLLTAIRENAPQGSGWGFDAGKNIRDRVHTA